MGSAAVEREAVQAMGEGISSLSRWGREGAFVGLGRFSVQAAGCVGAIKLCGGGGGGSVPAVGVDSRGTQECLHDSTSRFIFLIILDQSFLDSTLNQGS